MCDAKVDAADAFSFVHEVAAIPIVVADCHSALRRHAVRLPEEAEGTVRSPIAEAQHQPSFATGQQGVDRREEPLLEQLHHLRQPKL